LITKTEQHPGDPVIDNRSGTMKSLNATTEEKICLHHAAVCKEAGVAIAAGR
jgi:hypothetical protein